MDSRICEKLMHNGTNIPLIMVLEEGLEPSHNTIHLAIKLSLALY